MHDNFENTLINPLETEQAENNHDPLSPYVMVNQTMDDQPKEKQRFVDKIKEKISGESEQKNKR